MRAGAWADGCAFAQLEVLSPVMIIIICDNVHVDNDDGPQRHLHQSSLVAARTMHYQRVHSISISHLP